MIVLDTHVLLWWRDGSPKLSKPARRAIDSADRIGIPTVCCLELATLERRGRIALDRGAAFWTRRALAVERVEELPLTAEIAVAAGLLPDTFPGDPVDRAVYATAAALGCRLVTSDRRIRSHDAARVLW